jgi:hypothetical protein
LWWWSGCAPPVEPKASPVVETPVAKPAPVDVGPAPGSPFTEADAERVLFGAPDPARCPGESDRIRCLVGAAYSDDAASRDLALALYDRSGGIAGVEDEQWMDGGFRGRIHIVPERPVGRYRAQIQRVVAAADAFEAFGESLRARAKSPIRWRYRPIAWRFFRSVDRKTPSAYASQWTVGYNVVGSLNTTEVKVRETLFHELFHLNDNGWSRPALGADFDAIVAKCGTGIACLAPYAPGDTKVRNGTFYAFQPDNGDACLEYAAELALRYFRETSAILQGQPPGPAFKCGPEENRRSWTALVDTWFGGVDLVPPCSP